MKKFNKVKAFIAISFFSSFLIMSNASNSASAVTRFEVADVAKEIISQIDKCDHPVATVKLAYLQARKGVSIVQMTSVLPYAFYPTENDISAMVSRVIPAPRTTNSRLLNDGYSWLVNARETLVAGETNCIEELSIEENASTLAIVDTPTLGFIQSIVLEVQSTMMLQNDLTAPVN
jgi:hypothetical protein